ncbi:MAG TPA: protein translocase subunit SecD [Kofleriaceae bacterium]|nr:protein translocase subunit SecD [Kofleriaceae bacterium]
MDRKIKWRTFWLGLMALVAVVSLVPTLTQETPQWVPGPLQKKVQLGLDLQGGLHIVYSINLQKAVEDKATDIKRDIETQVEDAKGEALEVKVSSATDITGGVNVALLGATPEKRDSDKKRVQSFLTDYDEEIETRACPKTITNGVCYRVASDYAARIKSSALDQAIRTIRERIDERGIAEPTVISKGDQIIVELPGLDKEAIDRIKSLIARTARLEFRMVVHSHPVMQAIYAHVDKDPDAARVGIKAQVDMWRQENKTDPFYDYYLTAPDTSRNFPVDQAKKRGCWNRNQTEVGGEVECNVSGREVVEEYLAALVVKNPDLAVPEGFELGFEFVRADRQADDAKDEWRTYFLEYEVQLGGSAVQKAQVFWNPTTNKPEVLINFNRWGGKRFGDMTAEHVGHKMAIILDNKVNSAPVIQGAIRGGASTITMGSAKPQVAQAEADDLVDVLRTGSLPAPLVEESSSEVGPLLGLDAIRKTQFSFLLGTILTILIMVAYYRTSGAIAIGALALNILFMLAVLALFGATLTLPGIAAIVLTVGMAVDANIIIYERIREELRLGKSVRGAVDAGFSRGFAAILDGQLTTAAAGYVLMQYGSGPIRGFAVMLIIGIACTLFTATWCTRLFFEYYVGRGRKATTISI